MWGGRCQNCPAKLLSVLSFHEFIVPALFPCCSITTSCLLHIQWWKAPSEVSPTTQRTTCPGWMSEPRRSTGRKTRFSSRRKGVGSGEAPSEPSCSARWRREGEISSSLAMNTLGKPGWAVPLGSRISCWFTRLPERGEPTPVSLSSTDMRDSCWQLKNFSPIFGYWIWSRVKTKD